MRADHAVLTAGLSAAYVLTNGVFIFSNQVVSAVYLYSIRDSWVEKSIAGNLLFITIAIAFIRSARKTKTWREYQGRGIVHINFNESILLAYCLILILAESHYLLSENVLKRIYAISKITDRNSVYALRYDESIAIGEGQGAFLAHLAQEILFPLCALGISYSVIIRKKLLFAVLGAPVFVLAGLTAFSAIQRGPVFLYGVICLGSITWAILGRKNRMGKLPPLVDVRFLPFSALGLAFGALIYTFTEAESVVNGLYSIIERSFLITSFSGTSYYGLFGSAFPYQGVTKFLGFPVADPMSVTYADIGKAANGFAHTLNANFIATAYAALGYFGVTLISVIVLAAMRFFDGIIKWYRPWELMAVFVASIYGFFEVCNGPLANGIFSGLGWDVYLFILLFKKKLVWDTRNTPHLAAKGYH
ncbi:MAG: hypothetical protein QJR02_02160 [Sinobacteraceae bacterium]|nr:hypothetical protein [Nevskiaceae bacterium]